MGRTRFITAFQEDVARTFFDLPESKGFLLAGGAALIALGAVERLTDDLDFFAARGEGSVPAARVAFVARCRSRGWETATIWENDEFVRLSVVAANDKIEVDLGIDASLILPPTVTFLGPTIGLERMPGARHWLSSAVQLPGTSSTCSTWLDGSECRNCLSWRPSGT